MYFDLLTECDLQRYHTTHTFCIKYSNKHITVICQCTGKKNHSSWINLLTLIRWVIYLYVILEIHTWPTYLDNACYMCLAWALWHNISDDAVIMVQHICPTKTKLNFMDNKCLVLILFWNFFLPLSLFWNFKKLSKAKNVVLHSQ